MVNFSFNFKVLPSRELYSQFLKNFDLSNLSTLESNVRRFTLFLATNSSSDKIAPINLFFFFVRSSACCKINFVCSAVFRRSLTERYYISKVSDNVLERRRLRKFGFS